MQTEMKCSVLAPGNWAIRVGRQARLGLPPQPRDKMPTARSGPARHGRGSIHLAGTWGTVAERAGWPQVPGGQEGCVHLQHPPCMAEPKIRSHRPPTVPTWGTGSPLESARGWGAGTDGPHASRGAQFDLGFSRASQKRSVGWVLRTLGLFPGTPGLGGEHVCASVWESFSLGLCTFIAMSGIRPNWEGTEISPTPFTPTHACLPIINAPHQRVYLPPLLNLHDTPSSSRAHRTLEFTLGCRTFCGSGQLCNDVWTWTHHYRSCLCSEKLVFHRFIVSHKPWQALILLLCTLLHIFQKPYRWNHAASGLSRLD